MRMVSISLKIIVFALWSCFVSSRRIVQKHSGSVDADSENVRNDFSERNESGVNGRDILWKKWGDSSAPLPWEGDPGIALVDEYALTGIGLFYPRGTTSYYMWPRREKFTFHFICEEGNAAGNRSSLLFRTYAAYGDPRDKSGYKLINPFEVVAWGIRTDKHEVYTSKDGKIKTVMTWLNGPKKSDIFDCTKLRLSVVQAVKAEGPGLNDMIFADYSLKFKMGEGIWNPKSVEPVIKSGLKEKFHLGSPHKKVFHQIAFEFTQDCCYLGPEGSEQYIQTWDGSLAAAEGKVWKPYLTEENIKERKLDAPRNCYPGQKGLLVLGIGSHKYWGGRKNKPLKEAIVVNRVVMYLAHGDDPDKSYEPSHCPLRASHSSPSANNFGMSDLLPEDLQKVQEEKKAAKQKESTDGGDEGSQDGEASGKPIEGGGAAGKPVNQTHTEADLARIPQNRRDSDTDGPKPPPNKPVDGGSGVEGESESDSGDEINGGILGDDTTNEGDAWKPPNYFTPLVDFSHSAMSSGFSLEREDPLFTPIHLY